METLDMTFDFDELVVTSKVYRSTLASFMKQKIRGDKKGKSILSQEVAASVPLLQDTEQTQAHFKVPIQPIIATTTSDFVVIPSGRVPQTMVDSDVSNWALDLVALNDDSTVPPMATTKSAGVDSQFEPLTDEELDEIQAEATSTGYFEPKMGSKRDWSNGIIGTGAFKHEWSTKHQNKGGVDSTEAFTPKTSTESGGKDDITRTGDSESEMSTKWDERDDANYETDITSMISSSSSIGDNEIDFEFVYALHTFVAELKGQAAVEKGDTLVLLDDSNPYWWLIRVIKDFQIGYLPAQYVETPYERLGRLNKHRNIDLVFSRLDDIQRRSYPRRLMARVTRRQEKVVRFDSQPAIIGVSVGDELADEEEDISLQSQEPFI